MSDGEPSEPSNFYVWELQREFGISVKVVAESLFRQLNLQMESDTFLVAINLDDNKYPKSVVEPEDHNKETGTGPINWFLKLIRSDTPKNLLLISRKPPYSTACDISVCVAL